MTLAAQLRCASPSNMTATGTTPTAVEAPDRLAALNSYGILDTPPEQGFDDIA